MSLPDFSRGRILVVGDVMLDRYWYGSTSRISPEAPVPVVRVESDEERVGGAGNVALNAAALGARTRLVGLVGDDVEANRIEGLLQMRAVGSHLHRVSGSKTVTKLRVVSRNQQLIRLDFEDGFQLGDPGSVVGSVSHWLDDLDVVVLSDYAKGALRGSSEIVRRARAAGLPVIVDPKGTDFDRYRGATAITPNLAEFEAVVGRCRDEQEIEERGETLREELDLEAVLVTRSERGMTLLARGQAPLHLPTRAQEVFDVTGAGDTVVATLGAALAVGVPMAEAVSLANLAAGVVVAKLGTATVSPAELEEAGRREEGQRGRGILSEEQLVANVRRAQALGERVVMTNGCFDILHAGHVDYLERARALGDWLAVAVNDDESIRRLKGETRPINPLASRARMLASLACVDWVTSFSEDTPERLYATVLPDILVKGGDYRADEVAGASAVFAHGGEVRILDLLPGHSTTDIVRRILASHA